MKICINIVGQPKKCDSLKNELTYLVNNVDEYYFLYTTWDSENAEKVIEQVPNLHVKQVPLPDESDAWFKTYSEKYTLDYFNIGMGKKHYNYIYALFIRKYSQQHILEFEREHGFYFDIIITIRPDINIYVTPSRIFHYFHCIVEKKIFIARDVTYYPFNEGAVNDVLYMGKRNTMISFLDALPFIQNCVVHGTNIIHPETFNYKWINLFFESVLIDFIIWIF